MEFKLNAGSIAVLIILLGLIILGIFHSCNPDPVPVGPVYVEKPVELIIATDTNKHPAKVLETPPPANAKEVEKAKRETAFWKSKYDSLNTVMIAFPVLPPKEGDTSSNGEVSTLFEEYYMPYQIEVEDSTSINFVTIRPLNPKGLRATIDSTQYKKIKWIAKIELTKEDCKPFIPDRPWYDNDIFNWSARIVAGYFIVKKALE